MIYTIKGLGVLLCLLALASPYMIKQQIGIKTDDQIRKAIRGTWELWMWSLWFYTVAGFF